MKKILSLALVSVMLLAIAVAAVLFVPMKKFFAGKDILGR